MITNRTTFIILSLILSTGLTPIAIRITQSEGIPSLVIVLIRTWLVSLGLLPIIWKRYRHHIPLLTSTQILLCAIAGFWLALNLFSLFFALENTSVLITSVLRRTTPLWIVAPEVLLFGIVFTRRFWLSLLLTLVGVALITVSSFNTVEAGTNPLLGAGLACFGAIALGLYLLIGRKMSHSIPPLLFSFIVFVFAAIFSTFAILLLHLPVVGYSANAYIWTFITTFVAQVLGHIAINLGLQFFTASAMAIILQIGVVGSGVMALIIFGETPTQVQIIGSILVIIGVLIATIERNNKVPKSA